MYLTHLYISHNILIQAVPPESDSPDTPGTQPPGHGDSAMTTPNPVSISPSSSTGMLLGLVLKILQDTDALLPLHNQLLLMLLQVLFRPLLG